ncbi:MAG: PulJ/GspJ family protein [Tepidisphaeraceae bacterium]
MSKGPRPTRPRRRGFSFTEVMFAVVILGVGFIMIAAIFPVAIQQTKATTEETQAASTARSAMAMVEQISETGVFPATDLRRSPPASGTGLRPALSVPANNQITASGVVLSLYDTRLDTATRNALWNAVRGSMILPSDNRVAWTLLFRRDGIYRNSGSAALPTTDTTDVTLQGATIAQLWIIVAQARNRSTYTPVDDAAIPGTPTTPHPQLVPRRLTAELTNGEPDTITFTAGPTGTVVAGAYMVISDDGTALGTANGRIYRIGDHVTGDTWQLLPGNDMASAAEDIPAPGAEVFVLGREQTTPGENGTNSFEGLAQDVSLITTFIAP